MVHISVLDKYSWVPYQIITDISWAADKSGFDLSSHLYSLLWERSMSRLRPWRLRGPLEVNPWADQPEWRLLSWGLSLGSKITAAMKLKDAYSWKGSYDQPRQHIKKQRHYFVNKGPSSQGYGLSSGHVWMWESDYKESWGREEFGTIRESRR